MNRNKLERNLYGYMFILPLFLGVIIFYIYPFIQSFIYSFYNINNFNVAKYAGFKNYIKAFSDEELYVSLKNTMFYVILTVPITLILSLVVASLLNTDIRGKSIYRTLYFLPSVTMPAAIAMVWKWIFNGQYGLLNQFLAVFGVPRVNWLSNSNTAMYMIIIVGIWMSIGYNMIILLAGMQGISKSYYEAAIIDGANKYQRFFSITLPLLTPTIFFVLITSIISSIQVFATIYMMVGKQSLAFESTQSLVMIFYRNAFDYGKKGYASTIAIFIFLIIMAITAIQLRLQKKWVNYE